MSKKIRPQLKVLLLGDHNTGKTCYLTTLYEKRFPHQYIAGIAYSFTLDLMIPDASPLEDHSAWRGWLHSDKRTAGDAGNSEGQHDQSTKTNATVAPWDVLTGLDSNDRLCPLAYQNTDAVALCFSVVDRESFRNIRDQVRLH